MCKNRSTAALLLLPLTLALAANAMAQKNKPPPRGKDEALKLFAEEFVSITPGKGKFPASFSMGTQGDKAAKEETPVHTVKIRRPFAIARYEVTQELYLAVMGTDPSKWKGPRNSVEMVHWHEAVEFCQKATELLRERKLIGKDESIRLPTEAEWEYCCRASTQSPYSFGDADKLGEHAWFQGNARGEDPPVGVKKPNAWGLYDMHGYLWEWCADSWHPTYKGAPADGSAWVETKAKEYVVRSGSWADPAERCRSAARAGKPAGFRSDAVGFRCVRARKD